MTELVNERAAADHGIVVDGDFAGELRGVCEDYVVADEAVVGNMGVGHNKAV